MLHKLCTKKLGLHLILCQNVSGCWISNTFFNPWRITKSSFSIQCSTKCHYLL